MAEAGGPATQSGVAYQNAIAALYLGRMLDLRSRPARERVIQLQIEAHQYVDDILIKRGDGSTDYIQVKRTLRVGSLAWETAWVNFVRQTRDKSWSQDDRLRLIIGEPSRAATDLRGCSERAVSSNSEEEFLSRLTKPQRKLFDSVCSSVSTIEINSSDLFNLLKCFEIDVIAHSDIRPDYAPQWMPDANAAPEQLMTILTSMVFEAAGTRGHFTAPNLRESLRSEHSIEVGVPIGWGVGQYLAVMRGKAIIEVPGTSMVKPFSEAFLWPRASRYDRNRKADFDDEASQLLISLQDSDLDLSLFPNGNLKRLIVIAGPGFGKSILSLALAGKAIDRGYIPAIIPIPELSDSDLDIGEYLRKCVNPTLNVSIDWALAAESGRLVLLLDGLDEISSSQRSSILSGLKDFSLRYPLVPWSLTVRDAGALAAPVDALLVELELLNDEEIRRYISGYKSEGVSEQMFNRINAHPDLLRLVRIPLFLAIAERVALTSNRPWAQTLQFVLELSTSPADIVTRILNLRDDAFSTNLRMIARCVANGMEIPAQIKMDIANRLAEIWPSSTWKTQNRIGEILSAAFCKPMPDGVRAQLSNRHLLHAGTGKIVSNAKDRRLTVDVLKEILAEDVTNLLNISDLQDAVNKVADEALALYAERSHADGVLDEEINALSILINHLNGTKTSEPARLSVALNCKYADIIRLAAFSLGPKPIDERAIDLARSMIQEDNFYPRTIATAAISKTDDPIKYLRPVLLREDISLENKLSLIGSMQRSIDRESIVSICRTLSEDAQLSDEFRWPMKVFLARFGDVGALTELIEHSGDLALDVVGTTIAILGHHRKSEYVSLFVDRIKNRPLSPKDRVGLAGNMVTGMTYVFEMDWYRGGILKDMLPHPGIREFRDIVEKWMVDTDYSYIEELDLYERTVRLGSKRGLLKLADKVDQLNQINEIDLNNHDISMTVSSALRVLKENGELVRIEVLEYLVDTSSFNCASAAIRMIAMHGTRMALDLLLSIYAGSKDRHLKTSALDEIEVLASRLSLRVHRNGTELEVSAV